MGFSFALHGFVFALDGGAFLVGGGGGEFALFVEFDLGEFKLLDRAELLHVDIKKLVAGTLGALGLFAHLGVCFGDALDGGLDVAGLDVADVCGGLLGALADGLEEFDQAGEDGGDEGELHHAHAEGFDAAGEAGDGADGALEVAAHGGAGGGHGVHAGGTLLPCRLAGLAEAFHSLAGIVNLFAVEGGADADDELSNAVH